MRDATWGVPGRLNHTGAVPEPTPDVVASDELPDAGSTPPAVVDLLVHEGSPSGHALPATVLDLAARQVVHLEEAAPDEYLCRLPAHPQPEQLTP